MISPKYTDSSFTSFANCKKKTCQMAKEIRGGMFCHLKFIYSEKATKYCEISTLFLYECAVDKSKVEISPNFVAFSEYTNFNLKNI